MTLEEEAILQMLRNGQLNGPVGEPYHDERDYIIEHRIENGIPCTYEQSPRHLRFHENEPPVSYSRPKKISEYTTDEEKLQFFKQEGFHMRNTYPRLYSFRCSEAPSHLTTEERLLLSLLHSVNEQVGKLHRNSKGAFVSYWVIDGIPVKYEVRPIRRKVDGKSQIVGHTDPEVVKEYRTEKEKLYFLMLYGHYMEYDIFQRYSTSSGLSITLPKSPRELEQASAGKSNAEEHPLPKTELELHLLKRLSSGEFNGRINHLWVVKGGTEHWCEIVDGIPIQYSQAKASKFFNNKENETIESAPKVYRRYLSDDEKLEFFRTMGREIPDKEVQQYYWDNREKKHQH